MAIEVNDGIAILTTQSDFEGCSFSPPEAADLTSSPGDVLIADGYTQLVIRTPIFFFNPWTRWIRLKIQGTVPAKTTYALRFRVAETEEGIEAAAWSEWLNGIDADGTIDFNLAAYCLNNAAFAVGPYIQAEIIMLR